MPKTGESGIKRAQRINAKAKKKKIAYSYPDMFGTSTGIQDTRRARPLYGDRRIEEMHKNVMASYWRNYARPRNRGK